MQISKNTRLHNVLSMMDELTMSAAKDKRKYTVIKYSKATGSFYATDGKVAARYVMTELDTSINEGIEMLDNGYYVYYPAIGSLSNVEFTETFPDVERVIINFSIENTFKLKIAEIPDPDGRSKDRFISYFSAYVIATTGIPFDTRFAKYMHNMGITHVAYSDANKIMHFLSQDMNLRISLMPLRFDPPEIKTLKEYINDKEEK